MRDMSTFSLPRRQAQSLLSVSFLILVGLVALSFPRYLNRYVLVTLLLGSSCIAWHLSYDFFPDDFVQANVLRFLIMFTSHIFYILCTRPTLSGEGHPHDALEKIGGSPWYRGYKLLFNPRGVGTRWELRNLYPTQTPFAANGGEKGRCLGKQKSSIKPYWSAIAAQLSRALLNYILLCLYYEFVDLNAHMILSQSDFSPVQETIIRRLFAETSPITPRELIIRNWIALDKTIPEYLWLSSYHNITAALFISVGLDTDNEWPPIFGPISTAYTVRRYWGLFWHRIIYRSFSAYATVVSDLLGLRRGNITRRLFNNALVFALSGIMHGTVSWGLGNRCAWGRSLGYWMLQPVAFVLEGFVQAAWERCRGQMHLNKSGQRAVLVFERIVGYTWVHAWFCWCVPKRIYPLGHCEV